MDDIEARKKDVFMKLDTLEYELGVLAERVLKAREDLKKVTTQDEARAFDETHDLEDGLTTIQLF